MKIKLKVAFAILTCLLIISFTLSVSIYGMHVQLTRVLATLSAAALIAFLISSGFFRLEFLRSRQFMKGSANTIYTIAILGILTLTSLMASQASIRWDVTEASEHSLSDQTITVLQNIEEDLTVKAFFPQDAVIKTEVQALLEEYQYHSDKIEVNFIDPHEQPALAREYEITRAYTTVVKTDSNMQTISGRNLYDSTYAAAQEDELDFKFRGEQAFTRAIANLTTDISADIYFTTGHGEAQLHDEYRSLRSHLEGEGYDVNSWDPSRDGTIPDDADLVIIGGPRQDLQKNDVDDLLQFIDSGGKILVMGDTLPGENHQFVNLTGLVEQLGIKMLPDLVIDPMRAYYMDPESPVPHIAQHPITEKVIERDLAVALNRSRSLMASPDKDAHLSINQLLFASNQARSEIHETDQNAPHAQATQNNDNKVLGYAVEKETSEGLQALAVVLGDADFVTNEFFGFQGNSDFFLNCIQWLLDEEDLITIRPREPVPRQLFLTASDTRTLFYTSTLGLPLIILVIGGAVWLHRRNL